MRKIQHTIIDALGVMGFIVLSYMVGAFCSINRSPGKFGDPCDFAASYTKYPIVNNYAQYDFFIFLAFIFLGTIFIQSFSCNEKILARGLKYYFFRRMLISLLFGVILGYIACDLNTLSDWQSYSFECLGLGV